MTAEAPYVFRRMTEADLPLVDAWIRTPDVALWWEDPDGEDGFTTEDLQDPEVRLWIVEEAGEPFALLQDYDPHLHEGHPFAFLPPGSRGVDLLIGDPERLNLGHGTALMAQHIQAMFAEGAPAVGADPNPDNPRAIRACEKLGFVALREEETEWGRALLMVKYRE